MISVFWHGIEIGVMLAGALFGATVVIAGLLVIAFGATMLLSAAWDFAKGIEAGPPYRWRDPP